MLDPAFEPIAAVRHSVARGLALHLHQDAVRHTVLSLIENTPNFDAELHDLSSYLLASLAPYRYFDDVNVAVARIIENPNFNVSIRINARRFAFDGLNLDDLLWVLDPEQGCPSWSYDATRALANHLSGEDAQFVRDLLLQILDPHSNFDADTRGAATDALASQANLPEVQSALISLIDEGEKSILVRRAAFEALANKALLPVVRSTLLQFLVNSRNDSTEMITTLRLGCIDTLSTQTQHSDVRDVLVQMLEVPKGIEYVGIQSKAASALASQVHIGRVRNAVLKFIEEYRASNQLCFTFSNPITALTTQSHDDMVRSTLLSILNSKNCQSNFRWSAARSLFSQAHVESVRNAFVRSLDPENEGCWEVRHTAANALASQAHVDKVRTALLQCLNDSLEENDYVRCTAVTSLQSQLDVLEVRSVLLEWLSGARVVTWKERETKRKDFFSHGVSDDITAAAYQSLSRFIVCRKFHQ